MGAAGVIGYHPDRQVVEQQYANLVQRMAPHLAAGSEAAPIDSATLRLGYRYPTGAIVGVPGDDGSLIEDPSAPPAVQDPAQRTLSCFVTMCRSPRLISLEIPLRSSQAAVASTGVRPVARFRTGSASGWTPTRSAPRTWWTDGTLTTHYRATDSDAVLVHPDRFIAWRSAEHSNPQELEAALRHVLDR
jgi:putative polyketide hydroxylase